MYNELFESIIRTSGENTDDFTDRDNFWAPVPENLLFERVLREGRLSIKSKDDEKIIREPKSGLPYLLHYSDKIIDIFDRLKLNDKTALHDNNTFQNNLNNFYVSDTAPINQKIKRVRSDFSIAANFISINYMTIKNHYEKDVDHKYTGEILMEFCHKITDPFIISWYLDKKSNQWKYNFYLKMKINEKWTLTGCSSKRRMFIATIFGWNKLYEDGRPKSIPYVEYIDWNCLKNDKTKKHFENLIDWSTSKKANKKP